VGQYACRECLEGPHGEPPPAGGPGEMAPDDFVDFGPEPEHRAGAEIPDSLEEYGEGVPLAPEEGAPASAYACGACGSPILRGHTVCSRCGMDQKRGLATSALGQHSLDRAGKRILKCGHCGYDMTGVPSTVCPECGRRAGRDVHRRSREETEREVAKWMYLKPLIMLGVGLGVVSLGMLVSGGSDAVVGYLLRFGATIPVGLLIFFTCSLIWIGFDEPFHVQGLGLAAAYAMTDLVLFLLAAVLPGWLWIFVVIVAFVAHIIFLMDLLELEHTDAIILALLTFGTWIIIRTVLF